VEAGHGIVAVVLPAEEGGQLQLGQVSLQPVQGLLQLPLDLAVGALVQELVEDLGLLEALGQGVVAIEVLADPGQMGGQPLAAGGIVPDVGTGELPLEVGDLLPAALDVKGTPSRWRAFRRGPSRVRCIRSWV
jgi:hypothetical protein